MTTIKQIARNSRLPVEHIVGLFGRAGVNIRSAMQVVSDEDVMALEAYTVRLAMSRVAEREHIGEVVQ